MRKILASCLILWLCPPLVIAQICNTKIPEYFSPNANGDPRFTNNKDGTATDNMSGLIWMRCNLGAEWNAEQQTCDSENFSSISEKKTWPEALTKTEQLNTAGGFAGNSEWRLPNIKELASIVYHHCTEPKINNSIFIDTETAKYWSSTPTRELIDTRFDKLDEAGNQILDDKGNVITENKLVNGAWTMSFKIGRSERVYIDPKLPVNKNYVRLVHD